MMTKSTIKTRIDSRFSRIESPYTGYFAIFAPSLLLTKHVKIMKKQNRWFLLTLFVAALLLAACGGDDSSSSTPGVPDGPNPPAPTDNFSIIGSWVNRVTDNGTTTAEIVDLREGNTCTYHYEKSSSATMWEEKTGTWTEANGKVTAHFTKKSWYDGGSGSHAEDETIDETLEFPYTPTGNGILAYSSRMGGFYLYTRDGVAISLNHTGSELLGKWAYQEQWPNPESAHMFNQYSYTFNADGTFEDMVKVYNSLDNHYNQGSRRTGYFVVLPDGMQVPGEVARPSTVKGIVFIVQKAYMWDFATQQWQETGGAYSYPLEYLVRGNKLFIGRYGLPEASLLGGQAYVKQ